MVSWLIVNYCHSRGVVTTVCRHQIEFTVSRTIHKFYLIAQNQSGWCSIFNVTVLYFQCCKQR